MLKQLVISAVILVSVSAQAKIIVGTVDVQEVLLGIKQGDTIRNRLKKNFEQKKASLKPIQEKFQKMETDYQKKRSVWSDKKRKEKEEELQKLLVEIQSKTRSYQQEMQDLENKLKKPIIENIKVIITDVSKQSKVDVTFEVSSTPVLFAAEEKSLTKDVIKNYDKKYGSKVK